MHPAEYRCGAPNTSGRRSANKRNNGHRTSKSSPQRHRESYDLPLFFLAEYIPNRLYFMTVHGNLPKSTKEFHFFSTDDELVYSNFYSDFGPLHLGLLYKYCHLLNNKLKRPEFENLRIVHYTNGLSPEKRANAAYLISSYAVIFLNYKPLLAYSCLRQDGAPPFKSFQDACQGPSEYTITILDCLHALYKASKLGLVNLCDFDIAEYTRFERLSQGDLNWIVPEKLLAFCGPSDHSGVIAKPPEHYLPFFKENGIKTVVRLNRAQYRTNIFHDAGIAHFDLFIVDGGTPSMEITQKFLDIVENSRGAVAVHCKAGLGRTGTLIGAYLVKHYKMHAREAIAWLRICRPGSVIGPQHLWLESMEESLFAAGDVFRSRMYGNEKQLPFHEFGIYSVIYKKRFYSEKSNYNHYSQHYNRQWRSSNYQNNNEFNSKYEKQGKRRARSPEIGNGHFRSHSPSWRYAFTEEAIEIPQGDALNRIKASRHPKYMRSRH